MQGNWRILRILRNLIFGALAINLLHEFVYAMFLDVETVENPWWYSALSDEEMAALPVCVGFDPESKLWGGFRTNQNCPRGYAIVAENNYSSRWFSKLNPEEVAMFGNCCPMPFADVLTDEHVENVSHECPENHVVTGGSDSPTCGAGCYMRCTKINTEKYTLGPPQQSLHWTQVKAGPGSGGGFASRIVWRDLPIAIRLGIGRSTFDAWNSDGCVGFPFNSPLTKKENSSCDGFFHRQLRYLDGRPVPMYPDCESVEYLDNSMPHCVLRGG